MARKARRQSWGRVRKLPSGRWQARFPAPDGRLTPAPGTFDTKLDAEAWLSATRTDISRGHWKAHTPPDTMTFGVYAERWIEQRDLKPRTRDHYRSMLDRFLLPTFGAAALNAITPAAVRTWHAQLVTGRTYKAHAYSLLRTITRTAVDDGLIGASPCVIRGAGSVERAIKIKPATLGELEQITKATPEPYRLMVLLAAWCALRFGELTELRRKDIDAKAGVIRIRRAVSWVDGEPIVGVPKSAAGVRDVHIPPHLLPAVKLHLRDHVQWDKEALLFPGLDAGNLAHGTWLDWWHEARGKADRADLRFHDLRHTGAVLAAQTGATLAELMARLGHSTPAAAMRYQHAAAGRDAKIAELLSKIATASNDD